MESICTSIAEIVSALAAVIALMITVLIYWHGLRREIKLDTIRAFSEIRKKYYTTRSLNTHQKLEYLNDLEFFAIGVDKKVYDINIVAQMSGHRLIWQYDNWIKAFIDERNEKHSSSHKAYSDLEQMMNKIEKICKSRPVNHTCADI